MAVGADSMAEGGAAYGSGTDLRRFWMVGVVLLLSCLSAFAIVSARGPIFEAQAVVQVRAEPDLLHLIEGNVLTREALLATAARQGLTGADAAVTLRQAVALHDLTSVAGATLGLAPQISGLVISVRLSDVDQAVRVANDLALQVLDLGQNGRLDADHDDLAFYRAEEERLWQEISALRAELSLQPDAVASGQRKIMLLQDQYDVIRRHLAEGEVASRRAERTRSGQFAMLQRATAGQAVQTGQWVKLVSLAVSVLLTIGLALAAFGRAALLRVRARHAKGAERTLFGMPLSMMASLALVLALLGLAEVLR